MQIGIPEFDQGRFFGVSAIAVWQPDCCGGSIVGLRNQHLEGIVLQNLLVVKIAVALPAVVAPKVIALGFEVLPTLFLVLFPEGSTVSIKPRSVNALLAFSKTPFILTT